MPPGQVKGGKSFLRALQATGVVESIETDAGDGNDVQIDYDLDHPASKYESAGFPFTFADAFGPG